jgi:hypothetical protein
MTGFDLIDAARGIRLWLAVQLRRLAYEITVTLFGRIAKGSALDDRQRELCWRISKKVSATRSTTCEAAEAPASMRGGRGKWSSPGRSSAATGGR